jgi:hypothetical protein
MSVCTKHGLRAIAHKSLNCPMCKIQDKLKEANRIVQEYEVIHPLYFKSSFIQRHNICYVDIKRKKTKK